MKGEARSMHLVYTLNNMPGYTRIKTARGFSFLDTNGKVITNKDELRRIEASVLPPAWTNVWISPKPNGHLQATGIDAAGRKQYKYHSQWSVIRNQRKHNRMLEFAKALPLIRKKVNHDLHQRKFSREKVIALAISVMDKTFIRIGNPIYTKLYGSYGLTSLRNKHVKIWGNKMKIAFKGKKGVWQEVTLSHSGLSKIMKKLKDIPGQELFQYYDTDGSKKSLDSDAVNAYIEECTGKNFTAKDFRTWWGTVTAASFLADTEAFTSAAAAQKNIIATLNFVAHKLGNTRTVCRKYYVHPMLLSSYENGTLEKYLQKLREHKLSGKNHLLKMEENMVREFIRRECKSGKNS